MADDIDKLCESLGLTMVNPARADVAATVGAAERRGWLAAVQALRDVDFGPDFDLDVDFITAAADIIEGQAPGEAE